jgi:hypothetical protein
MLPNRLLRRSYLILAACLLGMHASNAAAAHIPGLSQLGGWTYIDRNNDGILNFAYDPDPEFAIGGVNISLFSKVANVESLVATTQSDDFGRYIFENINPGTYVLRQTPPVEFVDGKDTLGSLFSFVGQPIPPADSPGTALDNAFVDIILSANVGGEFYNFGERGLKAGYASKRYLLASAPPLGPPVPEPATCALVLVSLCGSWFGLRRRRS